MSAVVEMQERFSHWQAELNQSSVILSLIFLLAVVIGRRPLARWLMAMFRALLRRLSIELSEKVADELMRTTSVLIVTFAVFVVLETLNVPNMPGDIFRRVMASIAVIAVFSGWYNLSGSFVSLLQSDRFGEVRMEAGWMERVARFGILLFAITSLLEVWRVDISGALTGVGVLGAGLAIATQDLIRNLVAGMNNMSEKRFAIGDSIQIDGSFVGTVESIDLRSTLIRGFDQIPRHVPNSELSNAVVLNYSHRRHRRVMLSIPLLLDSTEAQVLQVRDTLREHLSACGDFELSEEAPKHVYVEGLSESAVTIIFYAWTTTPEYDNFLRVNESLSLKILETVRAAGTELAYPTQSINLRGSAIP